MDKNLALALVLASAWTIPWKGVALWKSARQGQKIWFAALFLLNTLAILEIIYIFIFSKSGKNAEYGADKNTGIAKL